MRLAVVGSRTFDDYPLLCRILHRLKPSTIVSGGAIGADSLAQLYSDEFSVPIVVYKPIWYDSSGRYNASAGFNRNRNIVDASDAVLAFWDGKSSGTQHTIKYAKSKGLNVDVITFNNSTEEDNNLWTP